MFLDMVLVTVFWIDPKSTAVRKKVNKWDNIKIISCAQQKKKRKERKKEKATDR